MASPRKRAAWMAMSRFSLSLLCPVKSASRRGRRLASNCASSAWRAPEISCRSGMTYQLTPDMGGSTYLFEGTPEEGLEIRGPGRFGFADRCFGLWAGATQVQQRRKHVLLDGRKRCGRRSFGLLAGHCGQLVAQLQHHAFSSLFAHAGYAH